jgi:hypothetical protein
MVAEDGKPKSFPQGRCRVHSTKQHHKTQCLDGSRHNHIQSGLDFLYVFHSLRASNLLSACLLCRRGRQRKWITRCWVSDFQRTLLQVPGLHIRPTDMPRCRQKKYNGIRLHRRLPDYQHHEGMQHARTHASSTPYRCHRTRNSPARGDRKDMCR